MTALIAHRGFAGDFPENTLRAVRRATNVADAVEVDVRRCDTGEPAVIHDPTVDRVTGSSGRVDELSRSRLASLSVLGTDAGVPTLREVLTTCPADVTVHVEVKEVAVANDVLDVVSEGSREVVISSFSAEPLRSCREAGIPMAYLHTEPGGIDRARDFGCRYVHPHHDLVDREYVDRARDAGLAVNAWTVREREEAKRLATVGVDGVIADRADVLDPP